MTVRQDRSVFYAATVKEVRAAVLRGLEAGRWWYSYAETVWNDEGFFIGTRIQPGWWTFMVSSEMRILLEESGGGCRMIVRTKSQRCRVGDFLHLYRRFVDGFLAMLDAELERPPS